MSEPFKEGKFETPPRKPKGWYTQKAWNYINKLIKAVKSGECTTNMMKIPLNPSIGTETDKVALYNAIKNIRRRNPNQPIDVSIIEGDLWLIYYSE